MLKSVQPEQTRLLGVVVVVTQETFSHGRVVRFLFGAGGSDVREQLPHDPNVQSEIT